MRANSYITMIASPIYMHEICYLSVSAHVKEIINLEEKVIATAHFSQTIILLQFNLP